MGGGNNLNGLTSLEICAGAGGQALALEKIGFGMPT
jgi:ubiquinone/menaquinone biosynthesis C-methylase UbiE